MITEINTQELNIVSGGGECHCYNVPASQQTRNIFFGTSNAVDMGTLPDKKFCSTYCCDRQHLRSWAYHPTTFMSGGSSNFGDC